jgi:hypothetical protein
MAGVEEQATSSGALSPRSNIILSASTTPQDAFDKDDFDAVAYINEMFPTGISSGS